MLVLLVLGIFGGCAAASLNTRIVHGHPMTPNEMPFLSILDLHSHDYWYHLCGAVLVAPRKVVTAAHCISGEIHNLRVVVGDHILDEMEGPEQTRAVVSAVKHPDWDGNAPGYPNDIAVLTLTSDVDVTSSAVSTIPLAAAGTDFTDQDCTIAGWGSKFPASVERHDHPSKATMVVISNSQCSNMWSSVTSAHILPGHVCMQGSSSACHYDYGGPMVCNGTLAGIMSWGDIACGMQLPSVMSSVAYYHDWIQQHI